LEKALAKTTLYLQSLEDAMGMRSLLTLATLMLAALGSVPADPVGAAPSTRNRSSDSKRRSTKMAGQPRLLDRDEQPYVAIRTQATLQGMPSVLPQLLPKVFAWLGERGAKPAGPPFIRYLVIDMERELDIEVGVPVGKPLPGDDRVRAGVLPAGRYATLVHTGRNLVAANAALQAWAKEKGIGFETSMTPKGSAWKGRVEFYLTDPAREPNRDRWQTEITYLVAAGKRR
jgi:effector-binding domain-containing protein